MDLSIFDHLIFDHFMFGRLASAAQVDYLMFVTAGRAREVERLTASELFNLGQSNTPKKKLIGRWFRRNPGGYNGQFLPPNLVW